MPDDEARVPRIWAIGGGKGGVGKSLVASSLGVVFAGRGRRCVVIDADLGAANLHTVLGVQRPPRTLAHFLNGEVPRLSDVMCPTSVPNLSLISGARALADMANPKTWQKQKLLRQLRQLDVSHVLLDLGAGSAFNVLDFFLASSRGILVVTPEPTSIENAYHFLKAAFFRSLNGLAKHEPVRSALKRALDPRSSSRPGSPLELVADVMKLDRTAGRLLRERASAFAPMLIVNQARQADDHRVGTEMSAACREYLGSELVHLGTLERDSCVADAVQRRQPVIQLFPHCTFARGIDEIARGLLGEARRPVPVRPGPTEHSARIRRALLENAALPPLDVSNPGAYLRRCRERLGLGLEQLSEQTRIRQLDLIENESFQDLPPEPYLRGFVQQYARALGIPEPDAIVASFLDRYRGASLHA
jgi:flagellar biosynthesis protein FlhG